MKVSGPFIVIVVLLVLFGIYGVTRKPPPTRPPKVEYARTPSAAELSSGARYAGQQFAQKTINPILKAPSTAKYSWDTVHLKDYDDRELKAQGAAGAWLVTGALPVC